MFKINSMPPKRFWFTQKIILESTHLVISSFVSPLLIFKSKILSNTFTRMQPLTSNNLLFTDSPFSKSKVWLRRTACPISKFHNRISFSTDLLHASASKCGDYSITEWTPNQEQELNLLNLEKMQAVDRQSRLICKTYCSL